MKKGSWQGKGGREGGHEFTKRSLGEVMKRGRLGCSNVGRQGSTEKKHFGSRWITFEMASSSRVGMNTLTSFFLDGQNTLASLSLGMGSLVQGGQLAPPCFTCNEHNY